MKSVFILPIDFMADNKLVAQSSRFDILDYGAVPDGKTINTPSLQRENFFIHGIGAGQFTALKITGFNGTASSSGKEAVRIFLQNGTGLSTGNNEGIRKTVFIRKIIINPLGSFSCNYVSIQ